MKLMSLAVWIGLNSALNDARWTAGRLIRPRWRSLAWGDRKHWDVTLGRLNVERWCSGSPCGPAPHGHHWVRVRIWSRAWSAASR